MNVNLNKIIVNKKEFYYTFEAIEYIKSLFPELFEQKIAQ